MTKYSDIWCIRKIDDWCILITMSVLSRVKGVAGRVNRRGWLAIAAAMALLLSVVVYGVWLRPVPPKAPTQADKDAEITANAEKSRRYVEARSNYGGALKAIDKSASQLVITGQNDEKSFRYDDKTRFATGLSYQSIKPDDIAAGTQLVITYLDGNYAETVWRP